MSGFRPNVMPLAPTDATYTGKGGKWMPASEIAGNSLYLFSTDTTATAPPVGYVKANNADLTLATEAYISSSTQAGLDLDSVFTVINKGDFILTRKFSEPTSFSLFEITDKAIDNTGWFTLPISFKDLGGSFVADDLLEFVYISTSTRANLIQNEILIRSQSSALTQSPTGTGPTNAAQIEYGAAVGTISDPVMMDAAGVFTFNESGYYMITADFQVGRTSNPGVAEVFIRSTLNGVQNSPTAAFEIVNQSTIYHYTVNASSHYTAGDVVRTEIMRDSAGNNSGGLIAFTPTVVAGSWDFAPTATITISRFIP